ncbi:cation transporter dimerization domain-containing protein [Acetomicrobium sp. S15 = DSM 107314]
MVESHDISEDLEEKLRNKIGRDTHITKHIEPTLEGSKAVG